MIVTIMQPAWIPWIGFFQRAALADRVVLLDDVAPDRSRTGFVNRNRVKVADGARWLSVPVHAHEGGEACRRIDQLLIDNGQPWARKMRATLDRAYARAPHGKLLGESLRPSLAAPPERLLQLIVPTLSWMATSLQVRTPMVRSSELSARSGKTERILDLCRAAGAKQYLSGPFGEEYLDLDRMRAGGVEVLIHEHRPQPYSQLHGDFVPTLSALDLILNLGPEAADFLRRGAHIRPACAGASDSDKSSVTDA